MSGGKTGIDQELIPMRMLKELAMTKIPQDHPIRDVFLNEKDFLTEEEFLAKLNIWGTLIKQGKS
jgi:hypothetical protein